MTRRDTKKEKKALPRENVQCEKGDDLSENWTFSKVLIVEGKRTLKEINNFAGTRLDGKYLQ